MPKKNALFWTSGPPRLPPPCLSLNSEIAPVVGALADPVLVAAEEERGAAERVRAALGDGVDAAAREAALAHVVRRDDQLNLLDRVEADWLRFGSAARRTGRSGQPEQVVVGGAIDLERVVAEAGARDRHDRGAVAGAAALRVEQRVDPDDVRDAARDGRQQLFDRVRNVAARARDRRVDDRRWRTTSTVSVTAAICSLTSTSSRSPSETSIPV